MTENMLMLLIVALLLHLLLGITVVFATLLDCPRTLEMILNYLRERRKER